MPRPAVRTPAEPFTTPTTPPPVPAPRGWVLVPAGEPGLLHRARAVVRNSRNLVLVALDPGVATPARACLAVGVEFAWTAPRPGCLTWFRDLTAHETAAALDWIAGPVTELTAVPAALHRRVAAVQPAGARPRGEGQSRA
ncbi:hypothetical protein ACFQ46_03585 [Kineococcus sp. GCM10028916]|uniref:hypothetical protein n=1 Tax=Kineococcus sp. GCM10028916 TaxID=3273394 RepID=UPI00362C92E8